MDSAVRKDFNAFDLIKINPFINNITSSSGGKVYVAIQFNRTVVSSKSGQTYTDKGYTEFVLTNENGKFKVYSMKNPLIFGLSDAGNVATGTLQATNNDPILLVDNSGNVNEQPFRTAMDIIENDSDINGSQIASETNSLFTAGQNQYQSFDFITSSVIDETDGTPSGHFEYYQQFAGMCVAAILTTKNDTQSQLLTGVSNIDSVTEAPTSGYEVAGKTYMTPILNDVYAFKLPNNKYALLQLTSQPNCGVNTMTFKYKYQPDGSTNF